MPTAMNGDHAIAHRVVRPKVVPDKRAVEALTLEDFHLSILTCAAEVVATVVLQVHILCSLHAPIVPLRLLCASVCN
jgi:BarA-like signal transduction histidine kinase